MLYPRRKAEDSLSALYLQEFSLFFEDDSYLESIICFFLFQRTEQKKLFATQTHVAHTWMKHKWKAFLLKDL